MTDFSEPTHAQDEVDFWRNLGRDDESTQALDEPPPADDRQLPNHFVWMDSERKLALTVGCRDCAAYPGRVCWRVGTAEPLRKFPAHTRRTLDARRNQEAAR